MNRAALVVNRSEVKAAEIEALYRTAAAACVDAGWPAPELLLADEADPGTGQAEQALRDSADLVVACGGDGTVNAVAAVLAGTGAALGIVPLGAGGVLAADLGLPDGLDEAVSTLITGVDRRIDLGRAGDRVVLGAAALGLAAALVADVPARLRKRIGGPAYLWPIARHLGDRGMSVTFELDGRTVRHRAVRTALIGNLGCARAGLDLIPDAEPDDGLLDLVVLTPRGRVLGWFGVLAELISSRGCNTHDVSRYRAGHIVARTRRPVAQEVDGQFVGRGVCLDVEVQHLALAVRVPRIRAAVADTGPPDPRWSADSGPAGRIGPQSAPAAGADHG